MGFSALASGLGGPLPIGFQASHASESPNKKKVEIQD